jgi:NMD protein affecting ribosome stability and mRNA decay
MPYASGKFAWAICERCSLRHRYTAIVTEPETNLRVCRECLDMPMPKKRAKVDGVPLRHPRPDVEVEI